MRCATATCATLALIWIPAFVLAIPPVSLLSIHAPIRNLRVNDGYGRTVLTYDGSDRAQFRVRIRGPILRNAQNVPSLLHLVPVEEQVEWTPGQPVRPQHSWRTVRLYRSNDPRTAYISAAAPHAASCVGGTQITDHTIRLPQASPRDLGGMLEGQEYAVFLEWQEGAAYREGRVNFARVPELNVVRVSRRLDLEPTYRDLSSGSLSAHASGEEHEPFCRPMAASASAPAPIDAPSIAINEAQVRAFQTWLLQRYPNPMLEGMDESFLLEELRSFFAQQLQQPAAAAIPEPPIEDDPRLVRVPAHHIGRDCSVCLETLDKESRVGLLHCGNDHSLCATCFRDCARRNVKTCPLCRADIQMSLPVRQ